MLKSNISLDSDAQAWAQQRSADLFFWTNLYSSCPIIIMTYILGLYTPKLGQTICSYITNDRYCCSIKYLVSNYLFSFTRILVVYSCIYCWFIRFRWCSKYKFKDNLILIQVMFYFI